MLNLKRVVYLFVLSSIFFLPLLNADFKDGDGFYELQTKKTIKLNKTKKRSKKHIEYENVTTFTIKKSADILHNQPAVKYKAYFFGENKIKLKNLIPKEVKKIKGIKSLKLKNLLIITPYNPHEKEASKPYKVNITKNDIPNNILSKFVKWEDLTVLSNSKATFKAQVDNVDNEELNNLLNPIGINMTSFNAFGKMSVNPIKIEGFKPSKVKADEFVKNFAFDMDLPTLKIKGLDKFFELNNITLGFNLNDYTKAPWKNLPENLKGVKDPESLNLMITADCTAKLFGLEQESAFLVDFGKKDIKNTKDKTDTSKQKTLTLLSMAKDKLKFSTLLKPFDLPVTPNLNLKTSIGYEIKIDQTKNDKGSYDDAKIELEGFGGFDIKGKAVDFTIDFILDGNKNSEKTVNFNYIQIDDNLKFSDIIGESIDGHSLPAFIKDLALSRLKFASSGVEIGTKIFEIDSLLYIFQGKQKGLNFAFDVENFSLNSLIPKEVPIKDNKHIKSINLPRAAIIYSTHGVIGTVNDVSVIAQDLMKDIYGKKAYKINIPSGLSLLGQFSLNTSGTIGEKILGAPTKGVNIGFSETAVVMGTLPGVLGTDGSFGIDFDILMDSKVDIKTPKAFKLHTDVEPGFFIKIQTDDFKIGAEINFSIDDGTTVLIFQGGIGVGVDEEGLDLIVFGDMNDNWKNPFGIYEALTISKVAADAIIKDDSTVHLGLGGKVMMENTALDINGALNFNIAARLPDGIAFRVGLSDLDYLGYYYLNLLVSNYHGNVEGYCIQKLCTKEFPPNYGPDGEVEYTKEFFSCTKNMKSNKSVSGYSDWASDLKTCKSDQITENGKAEGWAKNHAKKEANILTVNDAYLSFATPGAEDPILGIGTGVSLGVDIDLKGTHLGSPYFFLKKEYLDAFLNKIKKVKKGEFFAVGPQATNIRSYSSMKKKLNLTNSSKSKINLSKYNQTKKISDVSQNINDFKLGPISFKNNTLHQDPLVLKSKVNLFGKDEKVLVEVEKEKLFFNTNLDFGVFGKAQTQFLYKDSYYEMDGDFKDVNSFEKWLENQIVDDIDKIINLNSKIYDELNKKISSLSNELDKKQSYYDGLISKVGEEAYIDAKDAVKTAKKDWIKVKSEYNSYIQKCKDYKVCHKKYLLAGKKECNYPCKSFLDTAGHDINYIINKIHWFIGGSKPKNPKHYEDKFHAAYTNAEQKYYEPFKTKIKNEIDSLKSDLNDAKNSFNTIGDFKNLKKKIASLEQNSLDIKEMFFVGEYKNNNKKDSMFLLELKYSFKNKDRKDYFLFKPFDMKFNENSFALVSTTILNEFLKEETKLFKPATWLLSNVDKIMKENKAFLLNHIDKNDEEKLKKILDSFEKNTVSFKNASKRYEKNRLKHYENLSSVDLMDASKTFTNKYLAIGHSSLCLSVAPNGVDVYQTDCKDNDSERWSTNSIENGYVQLKSKGLCLKAKTKDNKSNGQSLVLSSCNNNDEHEKWKVISKDGLYDMIVNRYSQKCLHFDTANANPKSAYAVWRSCMDVDSQLFRDIEDTKKATHFDIKEKIEAKNGSCLDIKPELFKSFLHSKMNIPFYHKKRIDFNKIEREKQNVLISTKCTEKNVDRFNYLEEVNGDIKLVDTKFGWCVSPKEKHSNELVLIPCNRSKKVFWQNKEEGDGFELKNKNNKCITLDFVNKNSKSSKAHLSPCINNDSQKIKFVK